MSAEARRNKKAALRLCRKLMKNTGVHRRPSPPTSSRPTAQRFDTSSSAIDTDVAGDDQTTRMRSATCHPTTSTEDAEVQERRLSPPFPVHRAAVYKTFDTQLTYPVC